MKDDGLGCNLQDLDLPVRKSVVKKDVKVYYKWWKRRFFLLSPNYGTWYKYNINVEKKSKNFKLRYLLENHLVIWISQVLVYDIYLWCLGIDLVVKWLIR